MFFCLKLIKIIDLPYLCNILLQFYLENIDFLCLVLVLPNLLLILNIQPLINK